MPYTYDTLVADVIANMEEDSDEFVSALPTIIERAQQYIKKRIDPVEMLTFTSVSVSAGNRELTLPTDVMVLKSIQIETSGIWLDLKQQTNEFLTVYWPDYTSVGVPRYYATKNNASLFLAPTPISAGVANLEYIPVLQILTSAVSTNWYSEQAEDAFFAAAMHYTNLWSKNPKAAEVWKARADEECMAINNTTRRTRRGDSTDRSQGAPENNIGEGVV